MTREYPVNMRSNDRIFNCGLWAPGVSSPQLETWCTQNSNRLFSHHQFKNTMRIFDQKTVKQNTVESTYAPRAISQWWIKITVVWQMRSLSFFWRLTSVWIDLHWPTKWSSLRRAELLWGSMMISEVIIKGLGILNYYGICFKTKPMQKR